ncbi:hypothetical protein ATZ33_02080 [Enterococcus silesiacus]|uniref:Regulatory protein TetR n=1 Tax=Enterococcus silesiacus TaxID=332949 RepID=A0A0S3K7B9_9ENTE|nr:TetR/AcrR family transcriptional regulator [Enterococcus silesiacus]ALS00205.1 hypothetical protein ATZ33_02080 [Enterococcus silesiacus]OJG93184.1 regulatory protein TetR [Enterococcus silesiacus]
MKKNRKQVQESKQWIVDSLLALMAEQNIQTITVQQIAEKSDLHRRTFYRHFTSKEDVLDYKIQQMMDNYIPLILTTPDLTESKIVQLHFNFLEEHIDFLKILKRNNLFSYLLEKYNYYAPILYDRLSIQTTNPVELTFVSAFKAGGFWNVVSHWIDQENRLKPEEIAKLMEKFFSDNN